MITNDCLTRSGTGCFIAVPVWQQWASKCWTTRNYFRVTSVVETP